MGPGIALGMRNEKGTKTVFQAVRGILDRILDLLQPNRPTSVFEWMPIHV